MKKISYYIIFLVVVGVALISLWAYQKYFRGEEANLLLFEVERGNIQEVIKARGEVTSKKEFDLEFPFSGTIERVFADEGQQVNSGDPLMKLEATDFNLEKKRLEALLAKSKASLNKIIAGASNEEIEVAQQAVDAAGVTLANAKNDLENIKSQQSLLVSNAYRTLLNSTIEAVLDSGGTSGAPPTITGVYGDTVEGDYIIYVYGSSAGSYFSISGLEQGTGQVNTTSPVALGTKGLYIQFPSSFSTGVKWIISIPNTKASSYVSNYNAYQTALENQSLNISDANSLIESAQATLNQRIAELDLKTANARSEDVEIAKAEVREIESQILITKEKIRKSTIYSPTTAEVTKIWLEESEIFRPGQTVISLSATGYKIQSDISELEIGKIQEIDSNKVLIELDAFPDKEFLGNVTSVEPKEIIKDGDKYYRVNIFLEEQEASIRPGMSADLLIQTSFKEDVLKIPEFAVYEKDDKEFVKILGDGQQKADSIDSLQEVEIETGISDGENIEVTEGLKEGQTIVVSAD